MAGLLTAIGVTEIYRLGPSDAFKQGLWIVIGVALFAAALFWLRRDYRVLEQYKYIFGIGAILLLFLPRVPGIGETVNGARLWVHVGPMEFQPGEFSKIFLIVFLAGYLREKREVLAQGRLKDLGPLLVIWAAGILVIVATNDLGSALLYFGIFIAMLYVATARLSFVLVGLVLFAAGGFLADRTIPHVSERVTIWLHPWTTKLAPCAQAAGGMALRQDCHSYQLVKSLYSIANGGFAGTVLGKGTFTTTNGVALIPDMVSRGAREDVTIRTLKPAPPSRPIGAVLPAGYRSPAATAMLGVLVEVAEEWVAGRGQRVAVVSA